MLQLLQNYSIEDILIFIVILACALRGAVHFLNGSLIKLKDFLIKNMLKKQKR